MKTRRILGLTLLLGGCMASGVKVEEGALRQFQAGVTTYQEVEARLGKANTNAVGFDGTRLLVYNYSQSTQNVGNYIPIVATFISGESREGTQVLFRFDPQGRLIDYSATQGQTITGTGIITGSKPK